MTFVQALARSLRLRRREHSAIRVLPKLLSARQLTELLEETPDRRHLMGAAARRLSIPEEVLVSEVARRLGLPFLGRVLPMNLAVVPPAATLAMFRQVGAIAVTSMEAVSGLVCVDPAMVRPLRSILGAVPLYLGAWSAVERALDQSEVARREAREAEQLAERAQARETARAVLGIVLERAVSYAQQSVEVALAPELLGYEFATTDGRRARGRIDGELSDALPHLLVELAAQSDGVTMLNGRTVRITIDPLVSRATIRWDAAEVSPEAVASPPPPAARQHEEVVPPGAAAGGIVVPFPGSAPIPGPEPAFAEQAAGAAAAPRMVLVIDDNPTFARVLEQFLTRQNLATAHRSEGGAALGALRSGEVTPDLIICDVHMPGMGGHEFLRELRRGGARVPVIMLTSDTDVETELMLLAAGADAFLSKSEDPRLLCGHAERLLAQPGRRAA